MKTIAIIEDDQPIGDLLEEALSQAGYATLRAYSGTEAQYLLERAKPDLILLDLMLPGLTGEELLPCLGEIPVIVVSAKVGVDDKVNALLTGAADYVRSFWPALPSSFGGPGARRYLVSPLRT